MKNAYFLVLASLLGFSTLSSGEEVKLQLPFYYGAKYRCIQNSDDTPTHTSETTKRDLDFGLPYGEIVTAAAPGEVSIGYHRNGFGRYIKIYHDDKFWTIYAHLSSYIVSDGDQVYAGQPIAFSGNSGKVIPAPTPENPHSGKHLHFGLHEGNGFGESKSMTVYAIDVNRRKEGWFSTDTKSRSDFVCDTSLEKPDGHTYEAVPVGNGLGYHSCRLLDSKKGLLFCWEGNPTTCEDGINHTLYYKNSEGATLSTSEGKLWERCISDIQKEDQQVSLLDYLRGSYGVGGVGPGVETTANDVTAIYPPDFIVTDTWLTTPWGVETYKFGMNESFDTKAQSENIGDGPCVSGEPDTITGHFYLSRGYKEDAHSGDKAWRRLDSTTTKCDNLKPGDTHTETKNTVIKEWITEPGIYNVVYCIDHPQDDHNNGGDHQEKHESNNCSTEAVFEVVADPVVNVDPRFVDFVTSGLHFRGTPPYFAGDKAWFGATVTNRGNVAPSRGIRSSYSVECPGTGRVRLADDGTDASTLQAGASAFEETLAGVTLPNASGECEARFCADSEGVVAESDENNNCTPLRFILQQPAFRWSSAGAIAGMICTQITEPAEPSKHTWKDNYFCAYRDYGMRWNSAGPIAGMRCTKISEPADKHTWNDNYLCVPNDSPLRFYWSSAGPVSGKRCTQWSEPADPHTWNDNYLCYD